MKLWEGLADINTLKGLPSLEKMDMDRTFKIKIFHFYNAFWLCKKSDGLKLLELMLWNEYPNQGQP